MFIRPNQNEGFRLRVFGVLWIFWFLLLVLFLRAGYIQVIERDKYKKYARGETEQRIVVKANRGKILDRGGKVIVDNRVSYSLYITPAYFPKEEGMRKELLGYLSGQIGMGEEEIWEKVRIEDEFKKNKYHPILVKRDLKEGEYKELLENHEYFDGVEVMVSSMRRYRLEDNLSHILGYTGLISRSGWEGYQKVFGKGLLENPYSQKDTIVGRWGLEKSEDEDLRGEDGLVIRLVDVKRQPVGGSRILVKESQPGKDIYLTIDKGLQKFAKELLGDRRGGIIVTRPSTGEILAMVSSPSYNSNDMVSRKKEVIEKIQGDPKKPLYNRVLQGLYSPSSIFKLVVGIAGLEEGLWGMEREVNCKGGVRLGNRLFRCTKRHGKLDLKGAIEKSCNVYFFRMGQEVGWPVIYKYAKLFGLGEGHELGSRNWGDGILPDEDWKWSRYEEKWFPGDTFNHAIGQGYLLFHPIEVHNIISMLSNRGVLMEPYIIDRKKDGEDGEWEEKTYPKIKRSLKLGLRTQGLIEGALRGVVKQGTASVWGKYSRKYKVAGKTGTAEVIGGLSDAWFSGYAPYDAEDLSERIAVTVLVEDSGYGSVFAAPIATAIVKHYFEGASLELIEEEMGDLFNLKKGGGDRGVMGEGGLLVRRLGKERGILDEIQRKHELMGRGESYEGLDEKIARLEEELEVSEEVWKGDMEGGVGSVKKEDKKEVKKAKKKVKKVWVKSGIVLGGVEKEEGKEEGMKEEVGVKGVVKSVVKNNKKKSNKKKSGEKDLKGRKKGGARKYEGKYQGTTVDEERERIRRIIKDIEEDNRRMKEFLEARGRRSKKALREGKKVNDKL